MSSGLLLVEWSQNQLLYSRALFCIFSSRAVAYPHIVQVPTSEAAAASSSSSSSETANEGTSETNATPSASATSETERAGSETPTSMQAYSQNAAAQFGAFYNSPTAQSYIPPYQSSADSKFLKT